MIELRLQQCRLDGRYDILDCLGRGSYAEIYIAHDMAASADTPHTVVIKALNIYLQGVPDAELERTLVENFQNEAVALDRVRHPNITSRLGHGTAIDLAGTTFHYLVLEYLPGGDLAALYRQQPLPLQRALFYLEQVCAGLSHAHEHGVIHRDIKPQNLLLTADGQTVKIADFGVAKIEATEGVITRVGTNIYAAPEHNPLVQTAPLDIASLDAAKPHLTPAADIYSLAKTSYTLLAGEAPRQFSHRPITELPDHIANHPWAPAVLRVLQRATQTRPEERYQTVQEFWDELSDASLPPTQLLHPPQNAEQLTRQGINQIQAAKAVTAAPPRPQFESTRHREQLMMQTHESALRPRIVVPVVSAPRKEQIDVSPPPRQQAHEIVAAMPDVPQRDIALRQRPQSSTPGRGMRFLIALLLILVFAGMLLATHNYFRVRWGARTNQPVDVAPVIIGREGVTTTDVNLRVDPSFNSPRIGLAERGSRVRVLNIKNNFYEVMILQHGREKANPNLSDRGWINKRFLDLDS